MEIAENINDGNSFRRQCHVRKKLMISYTSILIMTIFMILPTAECGTQINTGNRQFGEITNKFKDYVSQLSGIDQDSAIKLIVALNQTISDSQIKKPKLD